MSATATADPVALFQDWLSEAVRQSPESYPTSFCLSTVDPAGRVDARFVDLKEISSEGFVFGTHLESPKARSIDSSPRVSLTFWWTALRRQVRVAGAASLVSGAIADRLFQARPRDAQAVSVVSVQSQPLTDPQTLRARVQEEARRGVRILRPPNWGAYCVRPERMEFLRFSESRFHERMLFVREDSGWIQQYLQP
ncbi:MAG TPA: pyridoxal 5'-phosphate synthase [Longimicrobiales bacterium]|nr:pyridoxal 5'-phosphate synthase [Longimicrobiales bacterium]